MKASEITIRDELVRRHLFFGGWILVVFLMAGLGFEFLVGIKLLAPARETRRLMWTLAEAHGALLGLVNLGFALTVRHLDGWSGRPRRAASVNLVLSTILMPVGFFLGGVFFYAGDPGLGILLVPVGGVLLFAAIFLTARAAS